MCSLFCSTHPPASRSVRDLMVASDSALPAEATWPWACGSAAPLHELQSTDLCAWRALCCTLGCPSSGFPVTSGAQRTLGHPSGLQSPNSVPSTFTWPCHLHRPMSHLVCSRPSHWGGSTSHSTGSHATPPPRTSSLPTGPSRPCSGFLQGAPQPRAEPSFTALTTPVATCYLTMAPHGPPAVTRPPPSG